MNEYTLPVAGLLVAVFVCLALYELFRSDEDDMDRGHAQRTADGFVRIDLGPERIELSPELAKAIISDQRLRDQIRWAAMPATETPEKAE